MSILVTGASGLVGYHLCEKLVSEGQQIVGTVHNTVNPALSALNASQLKLVKCDIRNYDDVQVVIRDNHIRTVFHTASHLPYTVNPDYPGVIVQGTANLLAASYVNDVDAFIYSSSMSVYSTPPDALPVSETHPTESLPEYGRTKLQGETMCLGMDKSMRIVILRFAGIYGKYSEKNRVINQFIRCAMNNRQLRVDDIGQHSSDFVYVKDAVSGAYLAWQKQASGVFNIGSGQETKLVNLADTVVDVVGSKSKVLLTGSRTDRPFRFYLDVTKAQDELGYSPLSLRDGLNSYLLDMMGERV